MTIQEFCRYANITFEQFYGREVISGSLELNGVLEIPVGFNPTVGCDLELNGLLEIPAGFNPTVGMSLHLNGLLEIPAGFNPTVGGSLELNGLVEIPAGFNPTVGGSLELNGLVSSYTKLPDDYCFKWQDGRYMKVDGIFTETISHKGNVYHVRKLNDNKIFYLVTDGDGRWAHGDTLSEAKEDLIYKVSNRRKEDYIDVQLDTEMSFQEAVTCYRVITGACSFGTKDFVKNRLKVLKVSYTIAEICEATKGEYKNETFVKFFNK